MPNEFNTTFIPKKVDIPEEVKKTAQGPEIQKGVTLLSIIAYLMIIVTLGSFLYVFYKRSVVVNDVEAMQAKINEKADVFDDDLLNEMSDLSSKLNLANSVVDKHRTFSLLFYVLPQMFLPEVKLDSVLISDSVAVEIDDAGLSEIEVLGEVDPENDIMISGSMRVLNPEGVIRQRQALRDMGFVKYFNIPSPSLDDNDKAGKDDGPGFGTGFQIVVDGEFVDTFKYLDGSFENVRKIEEVMGGDDNQG